MLRGTQLKEALLPKGEASSCLPYYSGGSPGEKLRGRPVPATEELGQHTRAAGELTARPKVASSRRRTIRGRGRQEGALRSAVDAAEGERDPKGSPQCPRATPSPLEDPGTMPKFGGNWGQCPVVFLDAGAVLPTSWPSRSVRSVFGAHRLFQNLSCRWDTVGNVKRPLPTL